MALELTRKTVTGTFETPAGTPESGSVTFQLSAPLSDSDGNVLVTRQQVVAELVNGSFSVSLVATNDPGVQPEGVTYTMHADMRGIRQIMTFELPYDAVGDVDIADLTPAASEPSYTYALQSALVALARRLELEVNIVVGDVETGEDVFPPGAHIPHATTLTTINAWVRTAPTGDDIVVALNRNGGQIATVTIESGDAVGVTDGLSVDLDAGDEITFDITSAGSGTPGAHLNVQMIGE